MMTSWKFGQKTLNKQILVRLLGQRTRLPNRTTAQVIDCLVDILSEQIAAGGRIEIANFLTFEVQMKARLAGSANQDEFPNELARESFPVLKCRPGKRLRQRMRHGATRQRKT